MPIRVLPPAIAARIAAGEVIERPASVVKELVENSIDAGASSIEVEIRHGGLAMIRITDNGCGIDAGEVALAFQRHATSKITDVDDLDTIGTFGFRGEALASIAAAAVVRMTTRTQEAAAATAIELEGGVVVRQGEASAAQGTTIEVETLFSTIPARMKFIRSAAAETARSRQAMDHLAMANPHVRFTFKTDGKTQLATSGNGSLRDVVAAVHGAELAGKMIEVGSWAGPYPVWGLTSSPEHSRANRTGISMFINSRWIFSRTISVALEDAYRGLLMEGRFPLAAIFVDVPPPEVDVNVHPNKREVRLLRDGDVFSSVQHAVRDALLAESPVADAGELLSQAQPTETPFASQAFEPAFELTTVAPQGPLAPLPEPGPVADPAADSSPLLSQSPLRNLRVLGQISNTYIVAEGPGGMYLIDQHAAHESVLYYRLLRQWSGSAPGRTTDARTDARGTDAGAARRGQRRQKPCWSGTASSSNLSARAHGWCVQCPRWQGGWISAVCSPRPWTATSSRARMLLRRTSLSQPPSHAIARCAPGNRWTIRRWPRSAMQSRRKATHSTVRTAGQRWCGYPPIR